ncbi:hypothetical protein N7540_002493 [Penicillium herquei]|nr:hypothetical protein N7540_002493 [Penicillium herquei]
MSSPCSSALEAFNGEAEEERRVSRKLWTFLAPQGSAQASHSAERWHELLLLLQRSLPNAPSVSYVAHSDSVRNDNLAKRCLATEYVKAQLVAPQLMASRFM